MSIFENFPYTNFHELNLDYILKRVKELEGEVADLTALLESGPVVDVKAKVSGTYTSIKDAGGNVNLPVADHTHVGGLLYDSSTFNEANMIGLKGNDGWEKIPTLDGNDQIDPAYLPPTVDVQMNVSGNWTSVVDGNGDAQIRKASPTTFGTVKVESSNDLSARKMKIYADGQYDALPTLDANDQIDASAIPDSGVTAGTYGQVNPGATGFTANTACFTVGADGRITNAQQRVDRIYRTAYATIAAGASTTSLYFNLANGPWYNNGSGFNVDLFEVTTTGKGDPMLVPLVLGTDYSYNITQGSTSIAVSPTLTATKSNPVAVVVNGSYGEFSGM